MFGTRSPDKRVAELAGHRPVHVRAQRCDADATAVPAQHHGVLEVGLSSDSFRVHANERHLLPEACEKGVDVELRRGGDRHRIGKAGEGVDLLDGADVDLVVDVEALDVPAEEVEGGVF